MEWKGKDPNTQPLFYNLAIDENFEEVFKATILEGHGYGENAQADSVNIIVNETALKTMDMTLESAVGTKINVWGQGANDHWCGQGFQLQTRSGNDRADVPESQYMGRLCNGSHASR